jgi:hypothetical protein
MTEPSLPPPVPNAVNVPKCAARGEKRVYLFIAMDDITARELASCVEIVMFGIAGMVRASPPQAVDQLFDALSDACKRHWRVMELPASSPIVQAAAMPQVKQNGGRPTFHPLHLPFGVKGKK